MNTLLNDILQLPPTDRLQLIQQIWDSLDTQTEFPLNDRQKAQLDRQLSQRDRPPRQGWNEQFARAAAQAPELDERDREWLDAPLTDWDNTEWEW